jgi:hypothetical protein
VIRKVVYVNRLLDATEMTRTPSETVGKLKGTEG